METRPAGLVLILIGIMMLIYTGMNFFAPKEEVDVEQPTEINSQPKHTTIWSSIVGFILIGGGIVIITRNKKVEDH